MIWESDDEPAFRKSLALLLRASGYEVVLHDSAEQLLVLAPGAGPGCILLDVKMPGITGPELQDRLNRLASLLPIIFLSGHVSIPTTVHAIKAGAEDFLAKPFAKEDLLAAIRRALNRYDERIAARDQVAVLQRRFEELTPREREVFSSVAQGQINKQIAFAFGISERTIKAHRQKVMQKMNAHSLLDLAAMAEKLRVPKPTQSLRAVPTETDVAS